MKEEAGRLVHGVKSITDFLSDAVEAFKDAGQDSGFIEVVKAALPWAGIAGEAAAEALPPLKFITKIADELLKETDPEKLGFTACTIAFQKACEIAIMQVPVPAGEKQSIKEIKAQLREVGRWEKVDMGTFSLDSPQSHEFYEQSKLCLQAALSTVGFTHTQIDEIIYIVQENFRHSLTKLLSDGKTAEKFEPFVKYMHLGGAEERRSTKMLAQHANYQRWLFEEAPVLRVSPFALKHAYIETDCSRLTWEEVNRAQNQRLENKIDPYNEERVRRAPLLETVLELIKSKDLTDSIIIQGVAGAGKSSFTLKLCDELLRRRLHPIRIRIKDLSFDTHIKDALPKAVAFTGEGYPEPQPHSSSDNLFLNDSIFDEKGTGDYEHICKYVIILDGWDEISLSDEGFKKKVAQMLDQINDHYLKKRLPVRVILTGRPSRDIGDTKCLREKSPFLTILKLTPDQLEKYVERLRAAVNSDEPLIELTDNTESWTVPELSRFQPVFDKYGAAFSQNDNRGELDVLGLPLLSYLTVRLVAEWSGDLTPLIENTTTLYRHLVDLTCKEAGKGDVGGEDSGDQYKIYGAELRELLQKTAHAITMSGGENISYRELSARLDLSDEQLDNKTSELEKENHLSALMISFYFKGGHSHLGCEFAHKSFREYFFAEAIIEALKNYGIKQQRTPAVRDTYWEDFSENKPNDFRFEFSRSLSELLAPQWVSPEVGRHISELIAWEIKRAATPGNKAYPGTATEPITVEQWKEIRTGLADLWGWWGEGVHLRPQPYREKGLQKLKPAYVNELIEWDAPRDAGITSWGYTSTTTMDAHLGEGLFRLCALVFSNLIDNQIGGNNNQSAQREYLVEYNNLVCFRPSGNHQDYFRNYISRINSVGGRFESSFPVNLEMSYLDFGGVSLNNINFQSSGLRRVMFGYSFLRFSNLRGANLIGANLMGADLSGADLREADLSAATLSPAKLIRANLMGADLSGADLREADLREADLREADLSGADLREADLRSIINQNTNLDKADITGSVIYKNFFSAPGINTAEFEFVYLNERKVSRDELLSMIETSKKDDQTGSTSNDNPPDEKNDE